MRGVVLDGLLAVVLAAVSLYVGWRGAGSSWPRTGITAQVLVVTVGATLPLAVRRRAPAVVWYVVTAFQVLRLVFGLPAMVVQWGLHVATYTVAAWAGMRSRRAVAATLVVLVGVGALDGGDPLSPLMLTAILSGLAAWLLGIAVKAVRANVALLAERAELRAEAVLASERLAIARELHDVVAHHMGLAVVRAEAGRIAAERDPATAGPALRAVAEDARHALAETRRLVGAWRAPGAALDQPAALDQLDPLLERARSAGLDVWPSVEGDLSTLPAGVGAAGYRIVREALSNVVRHAVAATRVEVRVCRRPDALHVSIVDNGTVVAGSGVGHGLVGIRERVALYGGTAEAGPRPGGGFAVTATLPIGPLA
ncbi:MAG TPA: histidine kinase [Rugosimonospora sp.]|nr:histidine kinase [Rugosimonospora sp.]